MTENEENEKESIFESFDNNKLSLDLIHCIYQYGWETPSIIQRKSLLYILDKRDIILQAQSGMGKTGTFCIGMLANIDINEPSIQGVIILPTRELADQVHEVISALSDKMNINIIKCISQLRVNDKVPYKNKATILVGTPGKLADIIEKRILKHQNFNTKVIVIDEFDKTLEYAFKDNICSICKNICVTNSTQVILSSATINDDVMSMVTEKLLIDPIIITIKPEDVVLEGIQQYNIFVDEKYKFEVILDLMTNIVVGQSIIFVNTKKLCDELYKLFFKHSYSVSMISSSMTIDERDNVIKGFRDGKYRVLLGTDIVARGIDIKNITLVINYDIPINSSQYIHRIGRTGRYGKKGLSINLVSSKDQENLRKIEQFYSIKIKTFPENFKDLDLF